MLWWTNPEKSKKDKRLAETNQVDVDMVNPSFIKPVCHVTVQLGTTQVILPTHDQTQINDPDVHNPKNLKEIPESSNTGRQSVLEIGGNGVVAFGGN